MSGEIDKRAARLDAKMDEATKRIGDARARNGGYAHGEAFALMLYRDDTTGREEWIWNSRDGVTPFGVEGMKHADWFRDVRAPWHLPPIGSRIFVDLTVERAHEHAVTVYERYASDPEYRADFLARSPDRDAFIASKAREMLEYGGGGSPDLVVVTPELHALFAARQPERRPR